MAKVDYEQQRTTWVIRDASGNIISTYEEAGILAYTTEGALVESTRTLEHAEVPIYGSGKLGTHYPDQNSATVYEITDHLGNVRALMRDNTVTYVATMEDTEELNFTNPRVEEMQYFENLFKTADENIAMNHTPPGAVEPPDKSAYLFWNDTEGTLASQKAIGPAIALRVRPGDVLEIETWAKFEKRATYNRDIVLSSLAALLGGSVASQTGFEGFSTPEIANNITSALINAQYPEDGTDDEAPFAYLNYILYDEYMNMVDAGWQRVTSDAGFEPPERGLPGGHEHLKFDEPITAQYKGYIYIWVSNQSAETEVWFDDLTVKFSGSFVAQSTDYGVWGDVIREQKSDESLYRYGYQGQFSERDLETEWHHFELREYDPVIGRWLVPDPYGQHWSPYLAMGNNPVNIVDPDGGQTDPKIGDVKGNQIFTEQGWAGLMPEITVEGTWNMWDKLQWFLQNEGGGMVFYSEQGGGTLYYTRNGKMYGAVFDPADAMIDFGEIGAFKKFPKGYIPRKENWASKTSKKLDDLEFGNDFLEKTGLGDEFTEFMAKENNSRHHGLNKIKTHPDTISAKTVHFEKGKIYRIDTVKLNPNEWKIIRRQIDKWGNLIQK